MATNNSVSYAGDPIASGKLAFSEEEENEEAKLIGPSPLEFMDEINEKGPDVINEWYDNFMKHPPKIDAFLDSKNSEKNRYPNVILYDRTRVLIKDKMGGDYYHASYVDSYEKRSYILAQSPFDEHTESDFWRLVYSQKPLIIILLAEIHNKGEDKRDCRQFWPKVRDGKEFCDGALNVKTVNIDKDFDTDSYDIAITGPGKPKTVKTQLLHFKKWTEDRVIPDNLMEFRAMMKIAIARAEKDESRARGPVVVMCPTGVHRSGSMAVLDIVLDRVTAEKKVGLPETVQVVHSQRYGCMSHFEHYSIIANLIVRHAVSSGMVDSKDIGVRKKSNF